MTANTHSKTLRDYLEALVEELSISDTRYEQADRSYHSLGNWLGRDLSTVKAFSPTVYIQGSFGLGTVIKPLNDKEEYDVDAVCELQGLNKGQLSQKALKEMVRVEVESYRRANTMLKPLHEGRRCWTLNYADGAQFHVDIVPALPNAASTRLLLEMANFDARWAATAISITDNETPNYAFISSEWPRSNPKGYVGWFKSRMAAAFTRRRIRLAEAARASVEDIPDYKVRTPLQAAIMLLKRHRDIMFESDRSNSCPISIVVTTLAAHAYQGEEEVADALYTILNGMDQHIYRNGSKYVIPNPTDPLENFADKWEKHPERATAFFAWLKAAREHFGHIISLQDRHKITGYLAPRLGQGLTERVEMRLGGAPTASGGLLRTATTATAGAISQPAFGSEARVPTKPQGFA